MKTGYRAPPGELAGVSTFRTDTNKDNLPPNTSKSPEQDYRDRPDTPEHKQQALPITPKHEKRRDVHRPSPDEPPRKPEFQSPPPSGESGDERSIHKDKMRSPSTPGEEYGHPYSDQGPAGIKTRRPKPKAAAMGGPPFPGSYRQKKQRGQAKGYSKRYYRKNKGKIRTRMHRWYNRHKRRSGLKRDKQRRRDHPSRFKRKPGGFASNAERAKDWRKKNPSKVGSMEYIEFYWLPTGEFGILLDVNPDMDMVTFELPSGALISPTQTFFEQVTFGDEAEMERAFDWFDEAYGVEEESELEEAQLDGPELDLDSRFDAWLMNPRLAGFQVHVRQRPKKRQRRTRGKKRFKSKMRYIQNRTKNKMRSKRRYRFLRKNPRFKKQQALRRKHPERFKRRMGSVWTSPEIAFVLGEEMYLGYVRSLSPMTGMVTFHRSLGNDFEFESLPVGDFLAVVAFLSEADSHAMFELIDVELGPEAYDAFAMTPSGLRGSAALEGIDCGSKAFKDKCEKLVGVRDLDKMNPSQLAEVDDDLIRKFVYDEKAGPQFADRERDPTPADKYLIDPEDDSYIYGQVNLPQDYAHLKGRKRADFLYEKPRHPGNDPDNWYDRGNAWTKRKERQEEEEAPLNHPYQVQVVNNPGSAKVIPSGHGFVNKEADFNWRSIPREMRNALSTLVKSPLWKKYRAGRAGEREVIKWMQDHGWPSMTQEGWDALMIDMMTVVPGRVAARISDIEAKTDRDIHGRARGLRVKLRRVEARNALWVFDVQGSKGPYKVKVQAPRKGSLRDIHKLDVHVACSCPFWQWQGPEHHAKAGGYLFGKARGTASKPTVKDPTSKHGSCKHVLAVLAHLKSVGTVREEWGKRRGSENLRYLSDRIALNEMRVLNIQRVAARYFDSQTKK